MSSMMYVVPLTNAPLVKLPDPLLSSMRSSGGRVAVFGRGRAFDSLEAISKTGLQHQIES